MAAKLMHKIFLWEQARDLYAVSQCKPRLNYIIPTIVSVVV